MKKIGIIDYGMGNLHSVKNALDYIGAESFVSGDPEELAKADSLILPGVGAFPDAMETLKKTGLDKFIKEQTSGGKPLLGICLGMQLLFDSGEEFKVCEGLGLIGGRVIGLTAGKTDKRYKIPHMGWNSLKISSASPLTDGMSDGDCVYFVHSFKAEVKDRNDLLAYTDHGEEIAALVGRGNVFGAQFHPEKSEKVGLSLLKRFAEL